MEARGIRVLDQVAARVPAGCQVKDAGEPEEHAPDRVQFQHGVLDQPRQIQLRAGWAGERQQQRRQRRHRRGAHHRVAPRPDRQQQNGQHGRGDGGEQQQR